VWALQGIAATQPDHIRELTKNESAANNPVRRFYYSRGVRPRSVAARQILRPAHIECFEKNGRVAPAAILGADIVDNIDTKTQPIARSGDVTPLGPEDKASIVLLFVRDQSVADNI